MPSLAILLLLTSAVLHTTWNLLLKQSEDKYIAIWWVIVFGGMLSLIALLFTGLPAREIWIFVALSVLLEAVYFRMLAYAYDDSDFSLVYPIARGAAPAFLVLWSFLILHEQLTSGGLAGISLIVSGLLMVGAENFLQRKPARADRRGVSTALFIALLISAYTLIDGAAVKRVAVLPYALAVFTLIPLPVTPFILRQYGWPRIRQVWREQRNRLGIIGVLGIVAYMFALAAYSMAPLSYSGAIREVSVVIGALAGWQILGEKMGGVRVFGAVVIFSGILIIAWLG